MGTTITLENIGGTGKGCSAWVAEIKGTSTQYGLDRSFLTGVRDYSEANRPRTRGVKTTYELTEGSCYEISQPLAWSRTERYFAAVDKGQIIRLSQSEILTRIAKQD